MEWASEGHLRAEHFETTILGGAWTAAHRAKPFDSVKAYASGKAATAWCVRYGAPRSPTLTFAKYGEPLAHALTLHWCSVLERYYTLFLAVDDDDYDFKPADHASRPKPRAAGELLAGLPLKHPGHAVLAWSAEIG